MNTEQQLELEEIKKLISDRFDKQDQKISDIRIELIGIKADTAWTKWLFVGLLMLILINVIIAVIFKLIS